MLCVLRYVAVVERTKHGMERVSLACNEESVLGLWTGGKRESSQAGKKKQLLSLDWGDTQHALAPPRTVRQCGGFWKRREPVRSRTQEVQTHLKKAGESGEFLSGLRFTSDKEADHFVPWTGSLHDVKTCVFDLLLDCRNLHASNIGKPSKPSADS